MTRDELLKILYDATQAPISGERAAIVLHDYDRLNTELAAMREERDALSNDLHEMDNARLEMRRKVKELLVMTGNAYKPSAPEVKP